MGLPIVSAVQVPSQAWSELQCGNPPGGLNEPCASYNVSWTSLRVRCVPSLPCEVAILVVMSWAWVPTIPLFPPPSSQFHVSSQSGGAGREGERERPFAVCPPQVIDLLTAARRQRDLSPHTDDEEMVIVRSYASIGL